MLWSFFYLQKKHSFIGRKNFHVRAPPFLAGTRENGGKEHEEKKYGFCPEPVYCIFNSSSGTSTNTLYGEKEIAAAEGNRSGGSRNKKVFEFGQTAPEISWRTESFCSGRLGEVL